MKLSVAHCCKIILLSCLLAACLPGKKQEEKVIAQAQQATQQVAAERLAADMSNAAQSLISSPNPDTTMPALQSKELQTLDCSSEEDKKQGNKKVIAYIKKSAGIAKNNELPKAVANRVRDQLQTQFSEKAIGTSELVSQCGGDSGEVAINSPVLILDSVSANLVQEPNDDNILSVNVASCPPVKSKDNPNIMVNVPGVIVTKTMKEGPPQITNKCGKAIEGTTTSQLVDNIQLTDNLMPDWKAQLSGEANKTVSFKCIVRGSSNKCVDANQSTMGDKIQCDDSSQGDDYVVNPKFKNGKFEASTTDISCQKGWTGKMVARVKSKQCKIIRNGVELEPAMIFDVAYVAAKCSRMNIPTQCPASSGSFYAGASMDAPVLLEPKQDANGQRLASVLAAPGYVPEAEEAQKIKSLLGAGTLFTPTKDLSQYKDEDQFSTALMQDMGIHIKKSCNIVGNGCAGGTGVPDHIVIVLDRSASMGSKVTDDMLNVVPAMAKGYSCQAGLSNIFAVEQSKEACSAAKEYIKQNPYRASTSGVDPTVMNFVMQPWAGKNEPTGNSLALYQKMEESLVDKTFYKPYLQFSLANGWDCSGRVKTGDSKEEFPADMYGTCSGATSCDTCPGTCQQTKIDPLPSNSVQRIKAADLILKSLARMKLKMGTKITLASFTNDATDIKTMTYCPDGSDPLVPSRQKNGVCDLTLERKALTQLFSRSEDEAPQYTKYVPIEVTIPNQKPAAPVNDDVVPGNADDGVDIHENTMTTAESYLYCGLERYDINGPVKRNPEPDYKYWSCRTDDCDAKYNSCLNGNSPDPINGCGEQYGQCLATLTKDTQYAGVGIPTHPGSYEAQSPKKATPGTKTYCDIRWAKTPTADGAGGYCAAAPACTTTTGPGTWDTAAYARSQGTFDDSKRPEPEYQDQSNYEFRNFTTYAPCKVDGTGALVCDNSISDVQWLIKEPPSGSGRVARTAEFTYANERRKKNVTETTCPPKACDPSACIVAWDGPVGTVKGPWVGYKEAHINGTFDDPGTYEYDDCSVYTFTCPAQDTSCIDTEQYKYPQLVPPRFDGDNSAHGGNPLPSNQHSYCGKRRWVKNNQPIMSDAEADERNEALAACLDKCTPKVVGPLQDVVTCHSSKNLFTGQVDPGCKTVKMPAKLDYRPDNYSKAANRAVVQTLYKKVLTDEIDDVISVDANGNAMPSGQAAPNNEMIYGADYGGNTPLFATVDKMLLSADVKASLNAKAAMSVIVLTDGQDTGDSSAITKDICNANKGKTLLSQLSTLDANAKLMVVSLDNASVSLGACQDILGDNYLYPTIFYAVNPAVSSFVGADQSGNNSNAPSSLESATKFCDNTYGSHYVDDKVPVISPSNTDTKRPSICRPFEKQ